MSPCAFFAYSCRDVAERDVGLLGIPAGGQYLRTRTWTLGHSGEPVFRRPWTSNRIEFEPNVIIK